MKYSEFKAEVEGLGFNVKHFSQSVYVENQENDILAKVDLHARYMLSTHTNSFYRLDETISFKLYELCMMLAETPLAEREEEKRYRLRIVANLGFMDDQRFLNLNIEREEYFICSARQSEWVKTIFTESEIAEMDITGFEKIEVTE